MYVAYFLIFFGVSCLIGSWTHLVITAIYQMSVHWLILSEERWCQDKYGRAFIDYRLQVRRYFSSSQWEGRDPMLSNPSRFFALQIPTVERLHSRLGVLERRISRAGKEKHSMLGFFQRPFRGVRKMNP
jgi:hypothetical protein